MLVLAQDVNPLFLVAGSFGDQFGVAADRGQGYLNRPDATVQSIDADGWLHTGDVAIAYGTGDMHLIGRIKEMYKSGGYNVYPPEIEKVIAGYDDVVQVAVVGAPDPLWESVGVAFLVVGHPDRFALPPLTAYVRSQLANYKVPKRIELLAAMPQLPNGKVDRVELRKRAARLVGPAIDS